MKPCLSAVALAFDRFLLALEPCLSDKSDADRTLYRLVHERNGFAFDAYGSRGDFTRLAENLLLDDYLDAEGHAANLFADADGKVRFHWEEPRPPREIYLQGVMNYLTRAESIIDRRAARMIEMLKAFC